MLTEEKIKKVLSLGEDSRHQFKREMKQRNGKKKPGPVLASEMVAFANSSGGYLFIGVDDDGSVVGIPKEDKGALNELVANTASQTIRPAIVIQTEWFEIDEKTILIIEVPDGYQKPYADNEGRYYMKVGSDKRVISTEELLRLFQSSNRIYLDELVTQANLNDDKNGLDKGYFIDYVDRNKSFKVSNDPEDLRQKLNNMKLADGDLLTLTGLLLFGKSPQNHKPFCIVKAMTFDGDNIGGDKFLDREEIRGKLVDIYETSMTFLKRNLKRIQPSKEFNQSGVLEIAEEALSEAIVNALVHRDYGKAAPVRILVFNNRVEVISPGKLPNHLTIENIKAGNTVQRNPTIFSFTADNKILPYSGVGSGVSRILRKHPDTEFVNDAEGEEFKVIFKRPVL